MKFVNKVYKTVLTRDVIFSSSTLPDAPLHAPRRLLFSSRMKYERFCCIVMTRLSGTGHSMISLVVSLQCIRVHSPNSEASEAMLVVFNQCLGFLNLRRTLREVSLEQHWHSCHLRHVLDVVVSRFPQLHPAKVFLLVCSLVISRLATISK